MARTFGIDAFKRYLSLQTHYLHALPIVILMPHSSCNCRCVMCDIWRSNGRARQLTPADLAGLLDSLKQLGTRQAVLSGGEALLNQNVFDLCAALQAAGLKVTLLSTGLLLAKFAPQVATHTDEVIVSLDGSEAVHNAIRRVPAAYQKLAEGVAAVKVAAPGLPVMARCVIQRLNFADWPHIVRAAQALGLDQISFLPADVSSEAFNRPAGWDADRRAEVAPARADLPRLRQVIEQLVADFAADFQRGFIAESPAKLRRIYDYYAALHGLGPFPAVECNAPWVSAVVEADGQVRPCFFHRPLGNIRAEPLAALLNAPAAVAFRQQLNVEADPICRECVCSLNLRPTVKVV